MTSDVLLLTVPAVIVRTMIMKIVALAVKLTNTMEVVDDGQFRQWKISLCARHCT